MIIGRLDRKINIHSVTQTQNSYGEFTNTGDTSVSAWARIEYKEGSVGFESLNKLAKIPVVFITRYNQGFTVDTLKYITAEGSPKYYVKSVQEIGRKQGLRIMAVAQDK